MSKYELITKDQAEALFSSVDFDNRFDTGYKPKGSFLYKEGDYFVVIDNLDGNAWTEAFKNKDVAIAWLTYELTTEQAYEADRHK